MDLSFTVNSKELKVLLDRCLEFTTQRKKDLLIKISVGPDAIQIETQGMVQQLMAETGGSGEIIVPEKLLRSYLTTKPPLLLTFVFRQGELQCGSSYFNSPSIIVGPLFSQPVNDLSINFTNISVLRLAESKSAEEIKQLGLHKKLTEARKEQKESIIQALEFLKGYNITFEDLKQLCDKKIHY